MGRMCGTRDRARTFVLKRKEKKKDRKQKTTDDVKLTLDHLRPPSLVLALGASS